MQNKGQARKKIVLGVTGGFGSGKTTVAGFLESRGAQVIDADEIARSCIKPDSPAYKRIIRIFGKAIINKDKIINRKKLGSIIFADKNLLKKLNRAVHPEVISLIKKMIKRVYSGIVVLDAPLLIEAGICNLADFIIVVNISKQEQIKRIIKKTGLSRKGILKRLNCQIPLQQKLSLADFIIDNNGTVEQTKKQVAELWRSLVRQRRTRD